MYCHLELVNIRLISCLERLAVLLPILVEVETYLSVLFSSLSLDDDSDSFTESFEHLWDCDPVFMRQCLGKREAKGVLNAFQLLPVIDETIIVLNATVDTAIEVDNLVFVQKNPSRLSCGVTLSSAEPPVIQSLHEFW